MNEGEITMKSIATVSLVFFLIITGLFAGCGKEEETVKGPPTVTVDPTTVEKIVPVLVDDLYRSVGTVVSKKDFPSCRQSDGLCCGGACEGRRRG